MVTHFDKEYQLTKLVKQGKGSMPHEFNQLANWIDKTYDVQTLNIIYDYIDGDIKWPRLQIILEYQRDNKKFRNSDGLNFDTKKQKDIVEEFKKIIRELGENKTDFLERLFNKNTSAYKTDNLLVVFSAFEPIAKEEANEQVAQTQIQELKIQLGDEEIWDIVRSFSTAIFFFYTNEQVKKNEANGVKESLSKKYLEILKPYDEFGYFKASNYSVSLDSKENFDNNFESSWFNYFR